MFGKIHHGMKILIVSWRSLKDPNFGGAEIFTYENAKRWVSQHGAKVTWLAPKYNNSAPKEEYTDGVHFRYIASPLTHNVLLLLFTYPVFYLSVFTTYFREFKNNIDIVIDQAHGIPYLTPLYVKEKVVLLAHEFAGNIWNKMYSFPVNMLGAFLERQLYKVYAAKNVPLVIVSESTKRDFLKLGFKNEQIHIVKPGVTLTSLAVAGDKAENELNIMFLNRLVKMKGVERALEVFRLIKNSAPEAKLWIVGSGGEGYVSFLGKRCQELEIQDSVEFRGYVDEKTKRELLCKAHVLINTSYKEGWGLVNIEANACGTPVVAFDVEGNSDSVLDGVSGFLVKNGDYTAMKNKIIEAAKSTSLRSSALEYSKQFSWEKQAEKFFEVLKSI